MNTDREDRSPVLPHGFRTVRLVGWIPVTKSIPEQSGRVLVWDELEMFQAAFTTGGGRTLPYFYHSERGHLPYVTHWQPLPEKP